MTSVDKIAGGSAEYGLHSDDCGKSRGRRESDLVLTGSAGEESPSGKKWRTSDAGRGVAVSGTTGGSYREQNDGAGNGKLLWSDAR